MKLGGTLVTSSATELNKLDGATISTSELNILAGDTSASDITLVDGDKVIINDGGTMKQVNITKMKAYIGSTSGDNTGITSILNSSLTQIGTASNQEYIKFDTANEINFHINNTERLSVTNTGIDLTGILTTDDISINGKVITMTGSTDDTAVFTAGTNGTLTIVTDDSSSSGANITITADGTAELAGTTVTLNSSGGIIRC